MEQNSSSMARSQSRDYAASSYSESTTYSYSKSPAQTASKWSSSLKQTVKVAVKDLGRPPTYRYDMEHGARSLDLGGPYSGNQRGSRS
jgi:hypothetical protein